MATEIHQVHRGEVVEEAAGVRGVLRVGEGEAVVAVEFRYSSLAHHQDKQDHSIHPPICPNHQIHDLSLEVGDWSPSSHGPSRSNQHPSTLEAQVLAVQPGGRICINIFLFW